MVGRSLEAVLRVVPTDEAKQSPVEAEEPARVPLEVLPMIDLASEQVERDSLFAEAERLYSGLPAPGAIGRTRPVTTQARTIVNAIDNSRRLVEKLNRSTAPLDQLRRRVVELRRLRTVMDVYNDIFVVVPTIIRNYKELPSDNQLYSTVDELLNRPPKVNDLSLEQEQQVMQGYYDRLVQANKDIIAWNYSKFIALLAERKNIEAQVKSRGLSAMWNKSRNKERLSTLDKTIDLFTADHPEVAGMVTSAESKA